MNCSGLKHALACVCCAVALVQADVAEAAEVPAAELRRLEAERIEWLKARIAQLIKEAGLSREQILNYNARKAEFTEKQLKLFRDFEIEVVARYEAWLKAAGLKQQPEVQFPIRRREPSNYQDRPIPLPPGSA